MDYLKDLIDAQKSGVAALMSFSLNYHAFKNVVACFVEGEDRCYYRSRVEDIVKPSRDILFYSCNGCDEVVFVRNALINNLKPNDNVKILYFCDKDYDLNLKFENIFYTDYYSIENYYCTREFVERVLINIFNFNKYEPNYYLALNLFDEKFKIFYDGMVKINSFAYSIRVKEKSFDFSRNNFNNISFDKFIRNLDFNNFEMIDLNYSDLVLIFNVDYVTEEEYLSNLDIIDDTMIRGKWILRFIVWFLENIRKELKQGTNGFVKSSKKIISFDNSIMVSMERYATTTSNLIDYIKNNI